MLTKRLKVLTGLGLAAVIAGCSHALEVKNLEEYARPLHLGSSFTSRRPTVGIMPFQGTPDALFFFNATVTRLSMDPGMGVVRTDYIPKLARGANAFRPDVIVSIVPTVTYRSSGWNFLINWPGFLIFTPSWNGYVYRADVLTHLTIYDRDGTALDEFDIPVSYSLRHADMDRTIWTGLTWLEVSALAFIGGIYNANVFDRDAIPPTHVQIKDNYSEFVLSQAQKRIQTVAAAVAPPGETEPDVEEVFGRGGTQEPPPVSAPAPQDQAPASSPGGPDRTQERPPE